ncbi:MAG TPA: hypothetical protein ENI19_01035 [Candidatus Nealsonbacteria bacterium]|uniref:Uncharacterized protein n=1 Tax=marine sediment metagenome TaxID=412755 RepID=A0A0F9VBI2_9ZZZZ|nr:hypothetical protein [Candidatus Nealsonbacteria bacterium]HEB46277.1 hypothetical protein [Candidatus Nealsonbacteria bacterium]
MVATIVTGIVFGVVFLSLFTIVYIKLGWWKFPIIPQIVKPEEMAIKVILGRPEEFFDSGLRWIPLWFSSLRRFPKTMYNLDYPAREAVTKRETIDGIEYGAQVLKVDSVAYVSFPQCYVWLRYKDQQGKLQIARVNSETALTKKKDELKKAGMTDIEAKGGLVEIYRRQIPIDEGKLKDFTGEAIVAALRVAMGKVTWRQATEDIEDVRKAAEDVFKSSDGALLAAGFHPDDLRLAIEEVKLPQELEQALPGPDRARLEAQAAKFVSQTRATETVGTVIEMMAQSRGKSLQEVQAEIEADPDARKEFLALSKDLIVRRMGLDKNAYLDIRVEGADGIEKSLLNLVAAWQRMPGGGKEKEEKEEKKGRRRVRVPGGTREMDEEERRRYGIP